MEHFKRNPLLHSISTQSTNKFRSIMNSPNYGNQQILLQSCCFFESEKSQTPHASHTLLKEFKMRKKNKSGSPKLSLSNGNLDSFKKYNILENNTEDNTDLILSNKNDKLIIAKLKRHNKALKETIKNLTSQLDRVCCIAMKVKNKEMDTIQDNNNQKEKNLKKEKNNLKIETNKKDDEYKKYKLNNKIKEIIKHNTIKNEDNYKRKFITEINDEPDSVIQKKANLSISVNKEMSYRNIINELSKENTLLKNKAEEQINSFNEKLYLKEKNIRDLIEENLALKTNINGKKNIKDKYKIEEINKEEENIDLKKENDNLSNKLIEAGKLIKKYEEKFNDLSKKYNNIIILLKKTEKENKNLNSLIQKNEKEIKTEDIQIKNDFDKIIKINENLIKEKNRINLNYNELMKRYDILRAKSDENLEIINKLKENNNEYISDNTLLSEKYIELKNKCKEIEEEKEKLNNKILNIENVNSELIKRLEDINNINTNFLESQKNAVKNGKIIKKRENFGYNFEELKNQHKILLNNYNKIKLENKRKEEEINSRNNKIMELDIQNKNNLKKILELEEIYNKLLKEDKILKDKNRCYQDELINLKRENKNISDSLNLLNKKYNKIIEENNIVNDKNIFLQKNNESINQIYKELKLKYDDLLSDLKKETINKKEESNILLENNIKSKSTKNNIIGKLKQDIFLANQKNIELNNIIKQKDIQINNYINENNQKNIELSNFKKVVDDLERLKNFENKLKSPKTSKETEGKCDERIKYLEEELDKKLLLIKEYESKINELSNEKNESENEKLKEKIKKLEIENHQEISNNISLNERNIKLEKEIIKANEELDLYEMECKEADIEIKSLKIKISELLNEIKKLKHIQTIEEVFEESNETEEKEDETDKIKASKIKEKNKEFEDEDKKEINNEKDSNTSKN